MEKHARLGGREGCDPPRGYPSSRFRTFPGAVRASNLSKKSENKTKGIYFQAAFDFDAPGLQNTTQKSKNIEKLNL